MHKKPRSVASFSSDAGVFRPCFESLEPRVLLSGSTLSSAMEQISVGLGGAEPNGRMVGVSISADGRYVLFSSDASNLVPGDTNGLFDVFLHDRDTGVTERIGDGWEAMTGTISSDGRYVTVVCAQSIYVYDRQIGTFEQIVPDPGGDERWDQWYYLDGISADGRYVGLMNNGINYGIHIHDLVTGVTEKIPNTGFNSFGPSISSDGRFVTFYNYAPGGQYVWLYDRQSGLLDQITKARSISGSSSVSADGRYLTFLSYATDPLDEWSGRNSYLDMFVLDRATGDMQLLEIGSEGWRLRAPSISADGQYVAYWRELVDAGADVVMVYDRGPVETPPQDPEVSCTVSGYIWEEHIINGQRDVFPEWVRETGPTGWTVTLFSADDRETPLATTLTNEVGVYSFTNITPGDYVVAVDFPDGWIETFTMSGGSVLHVGPGQTIWDVSSGGYVPPEVQGWVWTDLDGNGQRDPGEPGLEGWTVFLDPNQNATLDPGEPFAVTGSDGAYSLTGLSPGENQGGLWFVSPTFIYAPTRYVFLGGLTSGSVRVENLASELLNNEVQPLEPEVVDDEITLKFQTESEAEYWVSQWTQEGGPLEGFEVAFSWKTQMVLRAPEGSAWDLDQTMEQLNELIEQYRNDGVGGLPSWVGPSFIDSQMQGLPSRVSWLWNHDGITVYLKPGVDPKSFFNRLGDRFRNYQSEFAGEVPYDGPSIWPPYRPKHIEMCIGRDYGYVGYVYKVSMSGNNVDFLEASAQLRGLPEVLWAEVDVFRLGGMAATVAPPEEIPGSDSQEQQTTTEMVLAPPPDNPDQLTLVGDDAPYTGAETPDGEADLSALTVSVLEGSVSSSSETETIGIGTTISEESSEGSEPGEAEFLDVLALSPLSPLLTL